MFIRNPKFGNTFTTDTSVKIRRSLDGTLLTVVDPEWPIVESLKVSFGSLTDAEKDQLLQFLISTSGQEQIITDHEGFDWVGVIKSEAIVFRQIGRLCKWETEFEFQGYRV